MITVVYRGNRLAGLVEYLFGPGRFEEHRTPHIVAAWDPDLVAEHSPTDTERRHLTDRMERPRVLHEIGQEPRSVYHVAVALHLTDGTLTDTQWAQVANTIADRLGFTPDPATGRAGCHWVAVHHGPARDGRDHIHFATNLVRSDGTTAAPHRDYRTLSQARQHLETELNLTTRTRSHGAGMPGLHQGELRGTHRRGEPEPTRTRLARTVRACAVAARDETEFPTRLRAAGLTVRARYAPGGHHIVGYAVALPNHPDQPERGPVWFGGGKLAPDLTLPTLRTGWNTTPSSSADTTTATATTAATAATVATGVTAVTAVNADELHAAWTGRTPRPGTRPRTPDARQAWDHAATVIANYRTRVAALDPADNTAWAAVAGQTAGVLAALADRIATSGHRDPHVDRAADSLARAAQQPHHHRHQPPPTWSTALSDAARTMAIVNAAGRGGVIGFITVLAQLGNLVDTIGRTYYARTRAADTRSVLTSRTELLTLIRTTTVPPPPQPDYHHHHDNEISHGHDNDHDFER